MEREEALDKKMKELEKLLESVKDSYYDFVVGIMADVREYPDRIDEVIEYINNNPEATSSDIVGWMLETLDGIDWDNPPEVIIVDDEDESDEE